MNRAAQACRRKDLSDADRRLWIDLMRTYLDRKRKTLERRREIRRVSSGSLPRLQEVIFIDKRTLWLEHFEEDEDEIYDRDPASVLLRSLVERLFAEHAHDR